MRKVEFWDSAALKSNMFFQENTDTTCKTQILLSGQPCAKTRLLARCSPEIAPHSAAADAAAANNNNNHDDADDDNKTVAVVYRVRKICRGFPRIFNRSKDFPRIFSNGFRRFSDDFQRFSESFQGCPRDSRFIRARTVGVHPAKPEKYSLG